MRARSDQHRQVTTLEPAWLHEMGGKRALQMTPLVATVDVRAAVNECVRWTRGTVANWAVRRPQTPGLVPTETPHRVSTARSRCSGIASFFKTTRTACVDRLLGSPLGRRMADYARITSDGRVLVVTTS